MRFFRRAFEFRPACIKQKKMTKNFVKFKLTIIDDTNSALTQSSTFPINALATPKRILGESRREPFDC